MYWTDTNHQAQHAAGLATRLVDRFLYIYSFKWWTYLWSLPLILTSTFFLGNGTAYAQNITPDSPPAAVEAFAEFDPPVLVAPADGTTLTSESAPPLGMPTLSWQKVPDAVRYEVQISASAGFSDPEIETITYATTYTPEEALLDGLYYWRVKAGSKIQWGPYSEVQTFTKDWSNGGQNKPLLVSPLNDSEISAFRHDDFSWQAVPGAARYLLEISADQSFSVIVYSDTSIKSHHTPTLRLGNNRYYWRITPIDHQDHFGQSSEIWTFVFNWNVPPQLLSPEHDIDTPFLLRFSWSAVEAARNYVLEISTQPDFGSANSYTTANTDYTPEEALSNDQDYYWRVKAVDNRGTSSPWSEVRQFRMKWNFQPKLLTPRNNSLNHSYPFFSWTPVAGIERYQIQIDKSTSFDRPIADEKIYNATSYAQPDWKDVLIDQDYVPELRGEYFWRVRGIDAQNNYTPWSDVFSFRTSFTTSPALIYPRYYYAPDAETMPVHDDETIAWPLFVWDTAHHFVSDPRDLDAFTVYTDTEVLDRADYYSLTVTSNPAFQTVNFAIETAGLAAAPTEANPFNELVDGTLYYWRVRAMHDDGTQMGADRVWVTRIDRTIAHTEEPSSQLRYTNRITLTYPADSFEAVEVAPVLGWQPVESAHHYVVQVSLDQGFTNIVDSAKTEFVNYVPWQGRRTVIPFGTYWWRVRAEKADGSPVDNGNPAIPGGWSETRHFNVSRDVVNGNPYDLIPPSAPLSILDESGNRYNPELTHIADSESIVADPYDLGALHVMLDRTYNGSYNWVFAFSTGDVIGTTVRYGLYIDIDHKAGSGATIDPENRPITVDPLYLPDFVVYVARTGDTIDTASSFYYQWNGNNWEPAVSIPSIGGEVWYSPDTKAVQILLPYTSIGTAADEFVGSVALTVFSTNPANGGIQDSIPAQSGPADRQIDNPAFFSNMLMPLYPFDTPLSNPMVYREMPPMRWRMPYFDSVDGYEVQVARDARFTDLVETWETFESNRWPYFALMPATFQSLEAFEDNESYYWRVRIRHERYTSKADFYDYGPWSPPMRFKLTSWQVGNPTASTGEQAKATPSFGWQRVEGAAGYTLQVDDDVNFSDPVINKKLDGTSFTSLDALPDGLYYWRVATRRADKVINQWTQTMTFTKSSLTPVAISPIDGVVINEPPTFKWQTVLTDTPSLRVAAPLYRLQLDDDPNFSDPDTFESEATSFTISQDVRLRNNDLADGVWYWRLAIEDADGNVGAYGPTHEFYKEYTRPTLLSPDQGTPISELPNIEWSPVPGAAYYQIRIANDVNEVDSERPEKTDSTRYTPTDNLEMTGFYWQVQMFDDNGIPGPTVDGRVATIPAEPTEPDDANNVYLPMLTTSGP